jgi:class 3 adenylate cyclase
MPLDHDVHSEILTVMFIDIVGYTKTTTQLSRNEISQMVTGFDRVAIPIFHHYHGNVLKKIGDAFLVTFRSATDAVLCGIDLQKGFRQERMNIRVAIHTGEVVHRDNDIYGNTVNTAARIEGVAGPGDVMFSETVFHAMNKNEIPYVSIGSRKLKGLKGPVKLFRVKTQKDVVHHRVVVAKNIVGRIILWAIIFAILGGIAYVALHPDLLLEFQRLTDALLNQIPS